MCGGGGGGREKPGRRGNCLYAKLQVYSEILCVQLTKFQRALAYLKMLKFCKLDKVSIVSANRQDYTKYHYSFP